MVILFLSCWTVLNVRICFVVGLCLLFYLIVVWMKFSLQRNLTEGHNSYLLLSFSLVFFLVLTVFAGVVLHLVLGWTAVFLLSS